jgi:hypothetical protein
MSLILALRKGSKGYRTLPGCGATIVTLREHIHTRLLGSAARNVSDVITG